MNEPEARAIYKRLFVAFPQYREWLEQTESPEDTLSVWCKMLSNVPREAAGEAVERFIDGRLEMPKAYERDDLPRRLKSCSWRIKQDNDREERVAAERRNRDRIKKDRNVYKYSAVQLYEEAREVGKLLRDRVIDRPEFERRMEPIKKKAREKA